MADIKSFFKPKPKGPAAKQAGKPNPLAPTTFGGYASKLVAGQTSPPTVERAPQQAHGPPLPSVNRAAAPAKVHTPGPAESRALHMYQQTLGLSREELVAKLASMETAQMELTARAAMPANPTPRTPSSILPSPPVSGPAAPSASTVEWLREYKERQEVQRRQAELHVAMRQAAQAKVQQNKEAEIARKAEESAAMVEDDGVGQSDVIETFTNYKPAKLTIGVPHPDPCVETSSMSSVAPPTPNCALVLPREIIEEGN
jgi:hypothetical protein